MRRPVVIFVAALTFLAGLTAGSLAASSGHPLLTLAQMAARQGTPAGSAQLAPSGGAAASTRAAAQGGTEATVPSQTARPRQAAAPPATSSPKQSPSPASETRIHACGPAGAGFARCHSVLVLPERKPAPGPTGLSPGDLQSAYALPSSTASGGQTVAIVDAFDDPSAESDLAVYRTRFNLAPCTTANGCFRKVAQDGSTNFPRVNSGWLVLGGTSVGSPLIASVFALAGGVTGSPAAGSLPYTHTSSLNDVTSGSNGGCGTLLCNATTGWDGPTGLGTPAGTGAF